MRQLLCIGASHKLTFFPEDATHFKNGRGTGRLLNGKVRNCIIQLNIKELVIYHPHTRLSAVHIAPVGCSDCSFCSQYMTFIVGLQERATRVTDMGGGRGLDLFQMRFVFRKRANL